ncbi:uncharacterized protein [Littorina saxatilis]|uniref:Uncharacterized protein n=1 Tax=Littorina saxatilis TaxID=31220 RepID=A0AAN9AUY9_9CAEN
MMKLLLQIFAVIFACLLLASAAPSYELRQVRSVAEQPSICKRNHLCRWAVCPWSQWFRVSPENCQFVESTCRCPSDMQCERTNAMRPGSDFIVFKFRCQ